MLKLRGPSLKRSTFSRYWCVVAGEFNSDCVTAVSICIYHVRITCAMQRRFSLKNQPIFEILSQIYMYVPMSSDSFLFNSVSYVSINMMEAWNWSHFPLNTVPGIYIRRHRKCSKRPPEVTCRLIRKTALMRTLRAF